MSIRYCVIIIYKFATTEYHDDNNNKIRVAI